MSSVASPQVPGGRAQSSSASGLFSQGDNRTHCAMNSQSNSGLANLSASIPTTGNWNPEAVMGGTVRALNSVGNFVPSLGASPLATDANLMLSGSACLQGGSSINADSYLRLPASTMLFSSGDRSISGSSIMEGSSVVQPGGSSLTRIEPHQDQNSQQMQQRQQQGASSATSPSTIQSPEEQAVLQTRQVLVAGSQPGQQQMPYINQQTIRQLSGPVLMPSNEESRDMLIEHNQLKKRRLDVNQDDQLQQHAMHLLLQRPDTGLASHLQRQDSIHRQVMTPQAQLMLQQQKLLQHHQLQQQQLLQQSIPSIQRTQIPQQLLLCQHSQQHMHQSAMNGSYEGGPCARRFMQFIINQRQRPADNCIVFWRKLVSEYFAPGAKKRWCLSSYDNVGHSNPVVFPQSAMAVWQCEICGSKSGRGFETTIQVLPRLNKIKFDSGVIEELMFLERPEEVRLSCGIMLLVSKAVQETVYERLRVVREGQIRVAFGSDMKILSWEFCVQRHEELLPRRLIVPQVNQLLQVVQKYQTAVSESGSSGLSFQDLQENCDMFVQAVHRLPRALELQAVNDLGFPKRYIRCLQIAEVVNSMKDLIDLSREQNIGPIESLKSYPRLVAAAKFETQKLQEMQQMMNHGMPVDQTPLDQRMAIHFGPNHTGSNRLDSGVLSGSSDPVAGLSGQHNLLGQNSINSSAKGCSNQVTSQSSQFQGPVSSMPISLQSQALLLSSPCQGPSTSMPISLQNVPLFTAVQQSTLNPSLLQKMHLQSSQLSGQLQPHVLQQNMPTSNGSLSGQSVGGQKADVHGVKDAFQGASGLGLLASRLAVGNGFGNSKLANDVIGTTPSRNDSFKHDADSTMIIGGNSPVSLRSDVSQNRHLPELVQDIPHEFGENGIFSGEPANMDYGWKA